MAKKQTKGEDFTSNLLNALQNEHNELFARARSIETRASILISVVVAVLPFYIQTLDWDKIYLGITSAPVNVGQVFALVFFILSIMTICYCLVLSILIINVRTYYTLRVQNFEGFNLNEYLAINTTANQMNTMLILSYTQCIKQNMPIVDKKAKTFVVVVFGTIVYFVLIGCTILCNLL